MLDEPTASLTDSEINRLFKVIRTLKKADVAVIYVSHRLDEILTITDRVVVMCDGKEIANTSTHLLSKADLIGHITGQDPAVVDEEIEAHERMSMGEEILRVENLQVAGSNHEVSFSVNAGEILGIGGLVGAGRTELVRAIFGADKPLAGNIIIKGKRVRTRQPKDALKHGIVLLPEDRRHQGLLLDWSIRANITIASLKKHRAIPSLPVPSKAIERKAAWEQIKKLAIMTPSEEKLAGELSGGNQQKVVLAKWLNRSADLFIFDEPTQGIDVQTKQEVYRLMSALAAEGKGVIFISSEFVEIVKVCHRVIVLREGRFNGELTGTGLTESNLVRACYTLDDSCPNQAEPRKCLGV